MSDIAAGDTVNLNHESGQSLVNFTVVQKSGELGLMRLHHGFVSLADLRAAGWAVVGSTPEGQTDA